MTETLPPLDEKQRYSMAEASRYLRKSRAALYADISSGNLQVIRDGARVYVPGSVIAEKSRLPSTAA